MFLVHGADIICLFYAYKAYMFVPVVLGSLLKSIAALQNFLLSYTITARTALLCILITTKTMLQQAHNINAWSSFASEEEILKHKY